MSQQNFWVSSLTLEIGKRVWGELHYLLGMNFPINSSNVYAILVLRIRKPQDLDTHLAISEISWIDFDRIDVGMEVLFVITVLHCVTDSRAILMTNIIKDIVKRVKSLNYV